ncbi:hypothetical protein [Desulfallas thermosapovorans]|uniref:hypothetical protein n=1 Tax=Desulfallas thermosapovorans TaxID=58137 RepID=UPI001411E826|nr:hypothetical protein [Desulfallas thermosapovorans]
MNSSGARYCFNSRIKVDIPRPRDHRVTVSHGFTGIKKEIMEMLWEESGAALM